MPVVPNNNVGLHVNGDETALTAGLCLEKVAPAMLEQQNHNSLPRRAASTRRLGSRGPRHLPPLGRGALESIPLGL
eukprot:8615499-Alexandrium_andersonii.AAC.1